MPRPGPVTLVAWNPDFRSPSRITIRGLAEGLRVESSLMVWNVLMFPVYAAHEVSVLSDLREMSRYHTSRRPPGRMNMPLRGRRTSLATTFRGFPEGSLSDRNHRRPPARDVARGRRD